MWQLVDSTGLHLINHESMSRVWEVQQKHLACIQDPPGVQLYTNIGSGLEKGDKTLDVLRCGRGSSSLESFHKHQCAFIPGKLKPHIRMVYFVIECCVLSCHNVAVCCNQWSWLLSHQGGDAMHYTLRCTCLRVCQGGTLTGQHKHFVWLRHPGQKYMTYAWCPMWMRSATESWEDHFFQSLFLLGNLPVRKRDCCWWW